MRKSRVEKRILYKVNCPCGGAVTFDIKGFGQELPCGSCKGKIVVAWGRDAKNTTSIPVVVRHVPAPGKPALEVYKPAHRPVLKTQVLPAARFFDCVCGGRNVLMGAGPGKTVNCSTCDRVHVLEATEDQGAKQTVSFVTAPPPPAPPVPVTKQTVPFVPPPPPPPPRKVGLGEILCKCGEILPPRTSRTGRDFACGACGRKGHVVPAKDGVGIQAVFTFEPTAAACPCGADLPVSESLAGEVVACGACERTLEVVAKDGRIRLRERA